MVYTHNLYFNTYGVPTIISLKFLTSFQKKKNEEKKVSGEDRKAFVNPNDVSTQSALRHLPVINYCVTPQMSDIRAITCRQEVNQSVFVRWTFQFKVTDWVHVNDTGYII